MQIAPEELEARREIIAACRDLSAKRFNEGSTGNVSLRWRDGLLITPTSLDYDVMQPEDIVFLHMDGRAEGKRKPSSEWRFHRDILQARPEQNAVVHAHSTYATILAIMGMEIPAIHYMIALTGGDRIRVSDYATFGTEELSKMALKALEGRKACLLRHHGLIAIGENIRRAITIAEEVETLARQYHGCLQIGTPPVLPHDEIDRVKAKIMELSYGG
ncbi:class II aldolase/adducin family protein [Oryzibacter oryziterrae]|uniref:class II aldolase/adducin family protein n=1 Tax=Oryzibacter oryziterrae TaxID=2766474 RepID=UPI001F450EFF|nr:class II aldolase/adducin family protein [Oryzibacter oryziterrae]